jgi:hypothetical protein
VVIDEDDRARVSSRRSAGIRPTTDSPRGCDFPREPAAPTEPRAGIRWGR